MAIGKPHRTISAALALILWTTGSVVAQPEAPAPVGEIRQYGVTWTFAEPARAGK